jgi:hypothetical protein
MVVFAHATEKGGTPCDGFRVYGLVEAKPRTRNESFLPIYEDCC